MIDGRGLGRDHPLDLRWQKFVGLELELVDDHGLAGPIVMDATVAQHDGYRFVYTLPFGPRRVLVEDTYFSDGADLASDTVRERVLEYVRVRGWQVASVGRQESSVLPMALGGDVTDLWTGAPEGVTLAGLASGLFHPATGYSFPDAVRTADLIVALDMLDGPSIQQAQRQHSEKVWRHRGFYRYLNTMMFLGADPQKRYRVIERFLWVATRARTSLLCRAIDIARQVAHAGRQTAHTDRSRGKNQLFGAETADEPIATPLA